MTKKSVPPSDFERLISRIRQATDRRVKIPEKIFKVNHDIAAVETDSHENKLQILQSSKGYFNAEQAARILYELPHPADKVRALRILEPRLCLMSSREARTIIEAVSIHNDRLIALDCVKRVLTDCQTPLGEEYALSSLIFENDKHRARGILHTVSSNVADQVAAGGHQGYTALGGLHSQARPLLTNIYGDIPTQMEGTPGHGKIHVVPAAQPDIIPSLYTGHPSYAYPPDKAYADVRSYPGTTGYPTRVSATTDYPGGAPPLGHHSGAPAPTGFYNLEEGRLAY